MRKNTEFISDPEDSLDSDDLLGDAEEANEENDSASDLSSETDDSSSEGSVEIQDVFEVDPNVEATRVAPPNLTPKFSVTDICFHPFQENFAVATLDGEVTIYKYSETSVEEEVNFDHHKESVRAVCYSEDGSCIYTISKDKSISLVDIESSTVKLHIKDAHEAPIFSFCPIDENICCTGDDDGFIKVWDCRTKKSIFDYKVSEETVTSLISDGNKKTLACSVYDGSIAGFNIRSKKLIAQSEMYDSGFNSMCLVRSDTKLVVGSEEGALYIFNWGEFGHFYDRFKGHPKELSCLVPVGDKMIITGCEDGIIRAVNLYPHRFVGIVGQHKKSSVETLSVSYDGKYLASYGGMDDDINFWNIEYLDEVDVSDRVKGNKKVDLENNLQSSRRRNNNEFFGDFPNVADSDEDDNGGSGLCSKD